MSVENIDAGGLCKLVVLCSMNRAKRGLVTNTQACKSVSRLLAFITYQDC